MLCIDLTLRAVGVIGGYYYNVILPKMKMRDADDIKDFELEEIECEEILKKNILMILEMNKLH